jgi:hypothetical protein
MRHFGRLISFFYYFEVKIASHWIGKFKMKCVLVAIGWENIALQTLSAMLKENGHEVHLVCDQAIFDDKNYLSIP